VQNTLMGIPVELVAAVCIAIAALYAVFWPRPPRSAPAPRTLWQALVLRWFHSLTWALLALAALALRYVGFTASQTLGLLGLASYLIFMATLVREKMRYPQG
jgi:hypothetical protein